MEDVIVRYLHFLGIIFLSSMLATEHILLSTEITQADLKRLLRLNIFYAISALVVLAAGLTLWLWVGKPAAFYSHNIIFHIKLTSVVLMGLLAIYPTRFFLNNRGLTAATLIVPKAVINAVRLQLLLLMVIPLLAVLMAQGYGLK